jgi:UDP-N-acetylglucosamine 2-epimerase
VPALIKPIIILRDTTERPEVLIAGCGILAGVQTDNIVSIFCNINDNELVYQNMINKENPYGDGTTSIQIRKHFIDFFK